MADQQTLDWPGLVQAAKEKIARILWGLGGVSDGARELALKELLWEMEQLQQKMQGTAGRWENAERLFKEENELLRSLLGTNEHELRARVIALAQEIHGLRKDLLESRDEAAALRKKSGDYADSNDDLRRSLQAAQQRIDELEAQRSREWQSQMSGFAQEQTVLQDEMVRLDGELKGVQGMVAAKSHELTQEKQAELAALQAKLLKEMEAALRQKEDLIWAEEEIFARGVAQKLRGELQSATGRLQLTLEKFRLLETEGPATKSWEQWWRLIRVGPDELKRGFGDVSDELKRAVLTLEEYLALTHRRAPTREPVSVPELIHAQTAKLYAERIEKGALELLVPDVLPMASGDKDLLGQALQALVDNAFESLAKPGGRVRVKAERSPDEKEIWVDVSDTGSGVPPAQRDRLFQPFFTTKSGHRGLSLARARRYAEWHRGRVELVESGAQGSLFRLAIPL